MLQDGSLRRAANFDGPTHRAGRVVRRVPRGLRAVESSLLVEYTKYRRFSYIFIAIVLIMVWVNAVTSGRLNEPALIASAYRWQNRSNGVVVVPVNLEGTYKASLPDARARSIDTAVLGSSTVMSIAADMLHGSMYNFSSSAAGLHTSVGQAEYLVDAYDHIKVVLIGYDWALGYPFMLAEVAPFRRSHRLRAGFPTPSAAGLRKSLSTTQALFTASQLQTSILNDAGLSFVGQLFGHDVVETRCPTGERLAYFGAAWPGCGGFFPDGSVRFETFMSPLNAQRGQEILQQGLHGYAAALRRTNGEPNRAYLDRLAHLSATLKARGGRLVLVLPPLIPGLEGRLASGSEGASLTKLKSTVAEWAQANAVDIVDAGRSEDVGCGVHEFVDGHHALASCYRKALAGLTSSLVAAGP